MALDQPELPELDKLPFLADLLPSDMRAELAAPPTFDRADLLGAVRHLIDTWHGAAGGRLGAAVSVSAPQRVSPDYFAELDALSRRHGLPLYAHMLETKLQRVLKDEQPRFGGRSLVRYTADLLDAARRLGAEMVGHGLTNSDTRAGRDEADEAAYLKAVADRITAHEGAPPRGWSSPWLAQTEHTFDLLGEAGYSYLLDLRLDDQPVWLRTRGRPLLALPYGLEINDSSTVIGRQAGADEFARMIVDEFEELLAASEHRPLVMSIVVHSFISGAPFRLRALMRALRHIAERRERVWLATPGAIADVIAAHPERAV